MPHGRMAKLTLQLLNITHIGTHGFDELGKRVQEYPPDKVAEITWIPEEKIIEAAKMYAAGKPASIQWGVALDQTKECLPESHTPAIELIPDAVWRSHVIALPLIMAIAGHHIPFNETTSVEFSDEVIMPPDHIVLSPTSILVVSLVNPADSNATGDTDVTVTVTSTLDIGVVAATASLTLTMLPGF